MTTRRRRPAILTAFAAAAAMFVAGCGGGSSPGVANVSSSTSTSSASSGGPPTQQQQHDVERFAQCMRSHGVPNFPDPIIAPRAFKDALNTQSRAFRSAYTTCGHLLPGRPPSQSTARPQAQIVALLAFARRGRVHQRHPRGHHQGRRGPVRRRTLERDPRRNHGRRVRTEAPRAARRAPRAGDTMTSSPSRRTRAEEIGPLSKATTTAAVRESVQ